MTPARWFLAGGALMLGFVLAGLALTAIDDLHSMPS